MPHPGILPSPLRDKVGVFDHDRFRGYISVHCRSGLHPPCLRFAVAVAGHHARLGTRLLVRLCRGRHFRQLNFMRLQGATLTDPDARSMATSGRGTGMVGYNVQIAVDTKHHLIVTHEVINEGHDRTQLASMGKKALESVGQEEITALADRGYYNGEEVLALEGTGVLPCVPKTRTSNNPNRGLFSGQDFIYDAKADHYTCPAGETLTKAAVGAHRKHDFDRACLSCGLKPECAPDSPSTRDNIKHIKRWVHEGVLDKMQARLDRLPEAMTIRRRTVEHAFGTLKAWMGSTHFLTKTLKNVRTEMSLQVLAYNMKRMINMFGVKSLMAAIAA
jgi:hypothetical protein